MAPPRALVPPAGEVIWFDADRRPPPGPDAVVVLHRGAATIFDTSEDLHRAAAQAFAVRFAFDPAHRAPAPDPAERRARRWRRRLRRLRARLADPIVQAVLILLFGLPLVDGLSRGFQ